MPKRVAALIVATAVVAAGIAGVANASPSDGDLGGVNLNYYCSQTFGHNFQSVLLGKTAGDWRCEARKVLKQISVDAACRLQYSTVNVKSRALNWNDPLSWRCFTDRH